MDRNPASDRLEGDKTGLDDVETDPPITSIEVTENLISDGQLHLSVEVADID
jgi:hypothetical protein